MNWLLVSVGDSPLLKRRGGCASKKSREASEAAQTGWSLTKTVSLNDHPVRSPKEASRHFLDVASTPPLEEGTVAH